ncbi:unnamed protein product [Phytophthora lilii]|uniref:Unnamed protein product n=1 Tax=Phytophthora lilii TaxID=2077276 RepID=A0A9W6THH0_9STRA|nr:unnamed protein product [Phytophthora lilii]
MELEDALLLGMAFGPRELEAQAEWLAVPEAVRGSLLLVAKELRRLQRLLLANLPALQRSHPADRAQDLQDQLQQLQDAQDQAERRHRRTQQKLASLWGQVAATAQAAADAHTQQAAAAERAASSWKAAETQLRILQDRVDQQDRTLRRRQDPTVDAAIHELQKGGSQEIRRLQRAFEAHDHRVEGRTTPIQQDEVRTAEHLNKTQDEKGRTRRKKHDGAAHVLLHQRYVEALKKQQQQDRGELSTVVEDVSA